jgi:hypothetical protein
LSGRTQTFVVADEQCQLHTVSIAAFLRAPSAVLLRSLHTLKTWLTSTIDIKLHITFANDQQLYLHTTVSSAAVAEEDCWHASMMFACGAQHNGSRWTPIKRNLSGSAPAQNSKSYPPLTETLAGMMAARPIVHCQSCTVI